MIGRSTRRPPPAFTTSATLPTTRHKVRIFDEHAACSREAATQLLEGLGFKVDVEKARIYLGLGYVASSSPGGGNEIPTGSVVILHIV